ncbi:transcriptional regulator, TetR family [Anaerocolumna jejuensis DSM 15929]|uniref:Transcriptional regulator, TetR family n=1 Tax=Anaerocolumna jejuensis DSM 15929 TaxID=1121322 RepID=A0A1M6S4L8_9FIRM|nr:TetR/AcrR family transcriptional regulator [Anaerocolumna jejuensis]SHK39774.1 transcriptional regulator, TetR family [Anaerocolumna jejuensis DSM 15929]
MTTKERIMQESMKLFSVHGFAGVSVRSIAKEVGVENSALYKHFKNKQAIFDAIVDESQERFLQKYKELDFSRINTPKALEDLCITMFLYQTKDSWVTMFRRMLVMEMFKNPQMAEVYKHIFIDMPIQFQTKLFQSLIDQGKLRKGNAEVMSMELYSPFFLYHLVEEETQKLEPLLRQHVENFIHNYMEK